MCFPVVSVVQLVFEFLGSLQHFDELLDVRVNAAAQSVVDIAPTILEHYAFLPKPFIIEVRKSARIQSDLYDPFLRKAFGYYFHTGPRYVVSSDAADSYQIKHGRR